MQKHAPPLAQTHINNQYFFIRVYDVTKVFATQQKKKTNLPADGSAAHRFIIKKIE